ncbi:radial spokehead-like protein-domain-containing protein [Phlyctochytrium arcticum]|nr:radial spokehead-like protein-domain-containing protein [Phlyctochytrium arcticum]
MDEDQPTGNSPPPPEPTVEADAPSDVPPTDDAPVDTPVAADNNDATNNESSDDVATTDAAPPPPTEDVPAPSEPVATPPQASLPPSHSQQPEPQPLAQRARSTHNVIDTQPTYPAHPFLGRKDIYVPPKTNLPEESELALAKAFLMSTSEKSNLSVYHHMTELFMRVLETRPNNAVDILETISSDIKRSHFIVDRPNAPGALHKSEDLSPKTKEMRDAQIKLFERVEDDPNAEEAFGEIPDVMDQANLWEWAGASLGKEETFMLFLALKQLVTQKPLRSVRIWGKIIGTLHNYIIVEAELREGASDDDGEEGAAGAGQEEEERGPEQEEEEVEEGQAPLPKRKVKSVVPLSKEDRVGVNRYVYYVCNYAGGPWHRLPDVIPEKLQASRKIRKYFTGNLTTKVVSYPPFNDTEAQYLRCQIARISAATVVSPAGYYTFDQDEENEDEDNPGPQTIIINPEYETPAPDALVDPSNWVHHIPYILPQGRVTWENPVAKRGGDGDEDENENEDEEGSEAGEREEEPEAEPETGPPVLAPVNSDEDFNEHPAWSARPCSNLLPAKFSPIVLHNTRWPGSSTIAHNDKFVNIYIGDGLKDTAGVGKFVPPTLEELQKEYVGDDCVEAIDPTVAEEQAFEEERKAKEEEAEEGSGEEGEAEEDGDDD